MSIISYNVLTPGLVGIAPRIVQIVSTDNLATVSAAGYLNKQGQVLEGLNVSQTDEVHMIYSYTPSPDAGTFAIFIPSISNNIVTLVEWANPGNVLLPVVSGDVAVFNGTTGQISDSSILATNIVVNNAVNTMAAGSEIILDKAAGTESSHAVTINKQSGVITTTSLTTAAGASETITLTNSLITTSSVVLVSIMGGSNTVPTIEVSATAASGSSVITISNIGPTNALAGTVILGFLVV